MFFFGGRSLFGSQFAGRDMERVQAVRVFLRLAERIGLVQFPDEFSFDGAMGDEELVELPEHLGAEFLDRAPRRINRLAA